MKKILAIFNEVFTKKKTENKLDLELGFVSLVKDLSERVNEPTHDTRKCYDDGSCNCDYKDPGEDSEPYRGSPGHDRSFGDVCDCDCDYHNDPND
jgi:hypothetical protein